MMSYEMKSGARPRRSKTATILLLLLFLLAAVLLQTSLFGFYQPLGAVPDLTLIFVLCIGLFYGERAGGIFGLCGGVLLGALGSFGLSLFPLFYFLLGFFAGQAGRDRGERFPGYLLFLGISLIYRAVMTIIYASMTYQSVNLLSLLVHAVLPEMLVTAIAGILLFLPLRAICRRRPS